MFYAAPRLACVKPAASVHPEPGSNSSLYSFYIILSLSLTLIILTKELTLLDKLYFSVLASCTVISLFNELVVTVFSQTGCKGTLYFLISKFFLKNFSIFIFQRQSL